MVLFIEGIAQEDLGAVLGGLLAFDFGSPCVHWAHENVGAGFASFGIRAGGTLLLFAGVASWSGEAALLGLGAMVAAIPIDAAAFAWEDSPTDQAAAQRNPLSEIRIAPVLDAKRRSGSLFMTGNF